VTRISSLKWVDSLSQPQPVACLKGGEMRAIPPWEFLGQDNFYISNGYFIKKKNYDLFYSINTFEKVSNFTLI
jgi:hypothetical protein